MKNRKSFDILGKKIPVKKFSGPLDTQEHVMGYFDTEKFEIYINDQLDGEHYDRTMGHEIFHSVMYRYGFNQVITPEVGELLCEAFAEVVYTNFIKKRKK